MHKAEHIECMALHSFRIIILVSVCFLSIAARNLKLYYSTMYSIYIYIYTTVIVVYIVYIVVRHSTS